MIEIFNEDFRDQAIWFLNNHFDIHQNQEASENVFKLHQKCMEFSQQGNDEEKKKSSIHELNAHIILEFMGKPVTQHGFRQYFQKIDPNLNANEIPLTVLLFFFFDVVDWKGMLERGKVKGLLEANKSKNALKQARAKLDEAFDAEKKASKEAEEAHVAMENARHLEKSSSEAISKCKIEEHSFTDAKKQVRDALDQVNKQNDDIRQRRDDLERIIKDETKGIVKRNKAKAELRAIDNDDPLPLRKAKIDNENAARRLSELTNRCKSARMESEKAKKSAEVAIEEARVAKRKALESAAKAEINKEQAQEAIHQLKFIVEDNAKLIPWGSLFYIDREIKEAEKFLPKHQLEAIKQDAIEEKKNIVSLLSICDTTTQ